MNPIEGHYNSFIQRLEWLVPGQILWFAESILKSLGIRPHNMINYHRLCCWQFFSGKSERSRRSSFSYPKELEIWRCRSANRSGLSRSPNMMSSFETPSRMQISVIGVDRGLTWSGVLLDLS